MPALASSEGIPIETIHRGSITQIRRAAAGAAECVLNRGAPVLIPAALATYLGSGDEIAIPLAANPAGVEIHVRKNSASRRLRELYQAPIGYVTQPKEDKRRELFTTAGVTCSGFGVSTIHLPCRALRDYFYIAERQRPWGEQPTLYEVVRMPASADQGQLRLSFKIRQLELAKAGAPKDGHTTLERAYNILAQPELRACYDALLKDPDAPALFPYGGFGSLLVSGDRSRDGQTFFATRILTFRPELQQRRFHAPLRKFDFYPTTALYRDARRKLEVMIDQCAMPVAWDQGWNQWKHLLAAKIEIQGMFVKAGTYRIRSGEWRLVEWENALPSRLNVKPPASINEDLDAARKAYHRFGQYSEALDRIRARIEREPVEKRELERMLVQLGVPGDFDVSLLTWRPDYDALFYRQLVRRARRLYLYRDVYIFDLVSGVAVETPQLGHATYLFAQPASMERFLALYARTAKDDIRANRGNAAEQLGFIRRVVHGTNPRSWIRELKAVLGEPVTMEEVLETP